MKKLIMFERRFYIMLILIYILLHRSALADVDKAYEHLYEIMDKYHKSFDVYTDQDAGGNNFHPTVIGNYDAISLTTGCFWASPFGNQCVRVVYKDTLGTGTDWAAISWLFPNENWGESPGHDLTGAEKLAFWAKGEQGGEKVEFQMGGINNPSSGDPNKVSQGSCETLSTSVISLTPEWQEYNFDLLEKEPFFFVYSDMNAGANNRYIPSGWYNGKSNMKVDIGWSENPYSGLSCVRVEWNGSMGEDSWLWNGVLWQYPSGNWGEKPGYDLTGATQLTFWARTDEPGLRIKFFVGIDGKDSCGEVSNGYEEIDPTNSGKWTEHRIVLSGRDLSNVAGGFGFTFDDLNDPDPDGCIFYIDEIKFDRPVRKNLSNVIGGFGCVVNRANNPEGCTFYLDNIQFQLGEEAQKKRLVRPHYLVSYETTSDSADLFLRNTSFIYDNALALLAFIARGTTEDWKRAELLVESFNFCQNNDRVYQDGRLRNGYKSGDLLDPETGKAPWPSIYDEKKNKVLIDQFSTHSHTGNLAWVMIALSRYYDKGRNKAFLNQAILDSAKSSALKMGKWIIENCYDNSIGPEGFSGGYETTTSDFVKWKSMEHNLDVFIAFLDLARIDPENLDLWRQYATSAKVFIDSMWNIEKNFFWVGTDDGGRLNKKFVEDVQTWSLLASLYKDTVKLNDNHFDKAVYCVADSCYKECCDFEGFDFDTDCDGIWFEGTAHMALAYSLLGDSEKATKYLTQLRNAQSHAKNSNAKGIVAACHDSVTTNMGWLYHNRLHVGATAWYIFAEKGYNPYSSVKRISDQKLALPEHFSLSQNYPNPFNSETIFQFVLPRTLHITLMIFNSNGQYVRTLISDIYPCGHHTINWDATNDNGQSMPSGLYIAVLKSEDQKCIRKLILLK